MKTLRLALVAAAVGCATAPTDAALTFTNNPLYLIGGKANVLITLDNSNSMDEDASGAGVGSATATSKSEIARGVIKSLADTYTNRVNMGLMSYRQNTPSAYYLHNSPYDASYDSAADYQAGWSGARTGGKKGFRIANPSSAGNWINYNVNLPFYSSANEGTAFCYSTTANAFNNGENSLTGPWDQYRCFRSKTGTSNVLPTWGNGTSEAAQGYSSFIGQYVFSPTDSDYAQGILDFGKQMTWNYVSRAWYRNDSPGRGYLHVPIGSLTTTQATAIKNKLACNIPGAGSPCSSAGIPNAGLTPIEGTLLTAKDYFGGSWNNASEGYVSGCYPLPESCGKNFVVLLTDGLPSNDKNGAIVADPAAAIAAAAAAAATLNAAGIETYVIGFALPYGTDASSLNAIAAAGGTTTAYSATNTATLQAAFNAIFNDIFKKTSSFGSISQNSAALNSGTRIYQGRFDSTDWSGELVALQPDSGNTLTTKWSTSDSGRIAAPALRQVYTYTPGSGGVAFKTLGDLSAAQRDMLRLPDCSATLTGDACGQARIDWLRGDQSNEQSAGPFRKRARLLGDIISSGPFFVSDSNTIFVGANDGMLHAFDAATGNERFAYLPAAVLAGVYKLTDPAYLHQYYVDGEISVSTKFHTPGKNILVGALGRGGRVLYALDVTDPAAFGAGKVLWEFSDADLGLVTGKPLIAKLNSGRTAVIVGNGYNSNSERALLFVIDIETGALIRKIDTQAGSSSASNGMASPRGWDADSNGTVDLVFAGDRLGNLWKFDLSSATPSVWASAYTSGGAPAPMFVAKDSAGNRQPITGGIGLGLNPRPGDSNFARLYVFFGTGQYLLASDPADRSVQSWYGLIDSGVQVGGRSELRQRSIIAEGTITPAGGGTATAARAFSQCSPGDMVGKKGWVLDWVSASGAALGERVIGESKLIGTSLLASSLIPSTDVCQPGGTGYVNAIDPFTGCSLASPYFDVNRDGSFGTGDMLTLPGGGQVAAGSLDLGINLPSDGIVVGGSAGAGGSGTGGAKATYGGTNGQVKSVSVQAPRTGRLAWREIVRP